MISTLATTENKQGELYQSALTSSVSHFLWALILEDGGQGPIGCPGLSFSPPKAVLAREVPYEVRCDKAHL